MATRRMSDIEYCAAAGNRCPMCSGRDVEALGHAEAEGRECRQAAGCLGCGAEWTAVYRLTGFEDSNGCRRKGSPSTTVGRFLISGDFEPVVVGPFRDESSRDHRARGLRRQNGIEHGIHMLDVNQAGIPAIRWYSSGFFAEPKRGRAKKALP